MIFSEWTAMKYTSYTRTTYISVDLAYNKTLRTKVGKVSVVMKKITLYATKTV